MFKKTVLSLFSPKLILLTIMGCFMVGPLWAGTKIESRDLEGHVNTITVDGNKIRQELNESDYKLIDLDKNKYYTVVPNEKRIIDMSSFYANPLVQSNTEDRVSLHFKKVGRGPRVAGFKTTRYKMMINDFVCAEVYLSSQVYAIEDIKTLVKAFTRMAGREAAMGVSGDGDPCERAEFEMTEKQYLKLGVPMKTISRDGHTDHEVLKIITDTTISKKSFKLPKSYDILSVETLYKLME